MSEERLDNFKFIFPDRDSAWGTGIHLQHGRLQVLQFRLRPQPKDAHSSEGCLPSETEESANRHSPTVVQSTVQGTNRAFGLGTLIEYLLLTGATDIAQKH